MECAPCFRQYLIHSTAQIAQGLNAFVLDATLSIQTRLTISVFVLILGLVSIKISNTPQRTTPEIV